MQLKRSITPDWSDYIEIGLGLLALGLTVAVLAGSSLPILANDRAATFWLATLGIAMCTLRLGESLGRLGWTHPVSLAGSLLGAVLVLAIVAELSGAALPISERALFLLTAVVLFAKWGLGVYARRLLPASG